MDKKSHCLANLAIKLCDFKMDLIRWQLNFGLCDFVLKSYLWFQIKLALHTRLILKSRTWFQTKLHSTQFNHIMNSTPLSPITVTYYYHYHYHCYCHCHHSIVTSIFIVPVIVIVIIIITLYQQSFLKCTVSSRILKLIANVLASLWHHSQGNMNELMQRCNQIW